LKRYSDQTGTYYTQICSNEKRRVFCIDADALAFGMAALEKSGGDMLHLLPQGSVRDHLVFAEQGGRGIVSALKN
jgi:hypothetical protein